MLPIVSYVGREISQTKLDCTCGAEVTISAYREHLRQRHDPAHHLDRGTTRLC